MPQCIVIADDLTGANATGVLLKKMEYRTYTVMNMERLNLNSLKECDCIMYPTDSRGVEKDIAYNRVYNVAGLLKRDDVKLYSKRIDSTLRGNIGAETDAVLDVLGEEYIAVAAPCFPVSGRTVIGNFMLVHGLPLHKTEAAFDPKTPVLTSEVNAIFQKQSKYQVSSIKMNDMSDGKQALAGRILEEKEKGARIIVMDCVTQEDLDLIADAVITSKVKFVAIDPGVFTATLARKIIIPADKAEKKKILAVVGSVNPVTRNQMEEMWLTQKAAYNVMVDTKMLIESPAGRKREINRVIDEVLASASGYDILSVTGDGIYPENRISFPDYARKLNSDVDALSKSINDAFAEITYQIFKRNSLFKGLYTCGGDITVSVSTRFAAAGLCLQDEVLPLAAYGTFLKGEFDGVHIITKGGMVGEKDALNRCITYLKQKLYM